MITYDRLESISMIANKEAGIGPTVIGIGLEGQKQGQRGREKGQRFKIGASNRIRGTRIWVRLAGNRVK